VTLRLEKLAQTQLAGHAPEELTRFEADLFRRWRGLSIGIALDRGDVIARIGLRVSGYGVIVENTKYFGHRSSPGARRCSLRIAAHARLDATPLSMRNCTPDVDR
jgi:hypothetical protein